MLRYQDDPERQKVMEYDMIYNSFNFLILFPLIFLGYYLIPANYQKVRNIFLLLVSYLLYINWKPAYALVLLGVTAATYVSARLLEKTKNRKMMVVLGGGNFCIAAPIF